MPFKFQKLSIPDLVLVKPRSFEDSRGYFRETYKKSSFQEAGIDEDFVQDNHSYSKNRVLRGLHYQTQPYVQGKLVRCVEGEIFDVAVDIREGSPFYANWVGEYLSEDNGKMLYIPEGFAHGFLVTEDYAHVSYKVTSEYSQEHDAGIIWNDPDIGIDWPRTENLIISEKDKNLPPLKKIDSNLSYEES